MDGTTIEAPPAELPIDQGVDVQFPRPGFRLAGTPLSHFLLSSSGQASVPCLTGNQNVLGELSVSNSPLPLI